MSRKEICRRTADYTASCIPCISVGAQRGRNGVGGEPMMTISRFLCSLAMLMYEKWLVSCVKFRDARIVALGDFDKYRFR